MFEPGPGRRPAPVPRVALPSDAPNDLASPEYNTAAFDGALPASPLAPQPHATGFRWGQITLRRSIRDAEQPTTATSAVRSVGAGNDETAP